jgi:hypothetical protein
MFGSSELRPLADTYHSAKTARKLGGELFG